MKLINKIKKKVNESDYEDEYIFVAILIGAFITYKISIDLEWNSLINIISSIIISIISFIFIYSLSLAIIAYSSKYQLFRGIVIGFIICYLFFNNNNIYKINPEAEYITSTIDSYIEIDGYEYDLESYIKGNNNYFDLYEFVDDILWDRIDNEEICKISNKFIFKDGVYYHICDGKALFEPNTNDNIIEIY